MPERPDVKPARPFFSSGPCAKRPGYRLESLKEAPLGRSHRSSVGKARIKKAIDKTREILNLPADYLLGIVPASDTGAFEMAMWNLLGEKGVDAVYYESFGKTWAENIREQLMIPGANFISADYGHLPDLGRIDFRNDVVLTWNGTTSGVKIPNGSFIPTNREGLVLCDATSAVFAMEMPWEKLDAVTFSWQKVLGGEAGQGMLVLSPRAVERVESYSPPRPLPKIFRLKKGNSIMQDVFQGSTINTPSMLCVEDYLDALAWAEEIGGLPALIKRSEENLQVIEDFVNDHDWLDFLAVDPKTRSNTSVCLTVKLEAGKVDHLVKLLEAEAAAYDIASYREAPKGLRYWCGATVEKEDLSLAMQWLNWAYHEITG